MEHVGFLASLWPFLGLFGVRLIGLVGPFLIYLEYGKVRLVVCGCVVWDQIIEVVVWTLDMS